MLESLITSKTRIKLLLKFFLNSNTSAHLRGLESEFGESTNGIRLELNRFEQAGLLSSHSEGNRKIFKANTSHPLFSDIQHLVHKHLGLDQLVEHVVKRLGDLDRVYVTGSFAHGQESHEIELLLVGNQIDKAYLDHLISKAMTLVRRKVQYQLMSSQQFSESFTEQSKQQMLLLWENYESQK